MPVAHHKVHCHDETDPEKLKLNVDGFLQIGSLSVSRGSYVETTLTTPSLNAVRRSTHSTQNSQFKSLRIAVKYCAHGTKRKSCLAGGSAS